jgi:hypothetical protein
MISKQEFGELFTQTAIDLGYDKYSNIEDNLLTVQRYNDKNKTSRRLSFKYSMASKSARLSVLRYMVENKVLGEGWELLVQEEVPYSIGVYKKYPLE